MDWFATRWIAGEPDEFQGRPMAKGNVFPLDVDIMSRLQRQHFRMFGDETEFVYYAPGAIRIAEHDLHAYLQSCRNEKRDEQPHRTTRRKLKHLKL